jgi:hypothetical protein
MREFDHERMEVYRRALVFVRTANAVRECVVSRRAGLADQLDRAAVSIALNIAEGAGEFAKREKARFYRIARLAAPGLIRSPAPPHPTPFAYPKSEPIFIPLGRSGAS